MSSPVNTSEMANTVAAILGRFGIGVQDAEAVAAEMRAAYKERVVARPVLDEAREIIYGDRESVYGDPGKNLRIVANFWENYLEARGHWDRNSPGLTGADVCHMMTLLKIARLTNTPGHHDSLVDICGYTALVERCDAGCKTEEGTDPSTA